MKRCPQRLATKLAQEVILGAALIASFLVPHPVVAQVSQPDSLSPQPSRVEDSAQALQAQSPGQQKRTLTALRINPEKPKIDGVLDDEMWHKTEFTGGFTQKDPTEFEPASNQTEIAICYDDEAVYIAARMTSADPIMATVTRRDNVSNSERVIVSLDTYNNKRTAYSFGVTATGVRVDYYHGSDHEGDRDYQWNPVWEAAAKKTDDGWNAEMRIPLSQLRFEKKEQLTWGVNVNRWVPTTNEDSYWVLVPKNENGWSSKMGEIVGIQNIAPSRRIEVLPYVASDGTRDANIDQNDPFRDVQEYNMRAGADLKFGIGPNLTLEGSINPDFGQVEADPAVVNLSAFEVFFDERRPFFTEGSDLLSGGGASYFYSRRIGARPWGFANGVDRGAFSRTPNNTSIAGAAKLTGRTNGGLNVGILGAVTDKELGSVYLQGTDTFQEHEVQPRAGYGTIRLQQEFGKNTSTAGIILTGVQRDLKASPLANELRRRAFTGGTDLNLRFAGGKYVLGGNVGGSYVEGSPNSIANTQTSSARYYQRPDADYVNFDPARTTLTGWTSDLWFEKQSGKHWLGEVGIGAESPGFELNDAGQLGTADDIDQWARVRYRENEPGKIFQNWWVQAFNGNGWNFGKVQQYSFYDFESVFTFKNFIGTFLGYETSIGGMSDNRTRGGPLMANADSWNVHHEWWSGGNSRTSWSLWGGYWEDTIGGRSYWTGGSVTLRPLERLQVTLNPSWEQSTSARQYVTTESGGSADTFGERYIFSFIDQSELRMRTRVNFALTPDFTLEFYAEPFAASGRYYSFAELEAARTTDMRVYGEASGTSIDNNGDGTYTVTDGADTFDIDRSNFNILSYRSNFVLRWEWAPGSTFFFVWQQNRGAFAPVGQTVRPTNLLDSLNADGENFIAIKISYWIPFL